MAVTLVGEIVTSCDSVTGFNQGGISGDDDFVEGSGALGVKASNAYRDFYTTSLGPTAPYNFSSAGGESGYHLIMYFGSKSPLDATAGQRIIVGNGTSRGEWYVPLKTSSEPKQSVFVSRVVDSARNFDRIAAGSWSLTGNPTQLSNITQAGGGLQSIVSIMGSFNNVQIDQLTIGLGARVDAGTTGAPNTFETVRAQDEDTSKWGWWSSVLGAIVGKGKLYIGPATGTATSVFIDADFSILFADELVASDFYEINTRGANTDVTWTRGSLSAANPAIARWGLTVQSDTGTFTDDSGIWKGAGALVLNANSTLEGTVLIDCNVLTQNGATISNCKILEANTSDGLAFIMSDDPGLITGCDFVFSDGHAVEITAPGTYSWTNNTNSGYGADGTNDALIYNNSGGAVILNVSGGDTPTVRNGAGASTTVNNTVTFTMTNVVSGSQLYVEAIAGGTLSAGAVMVGPVIVTADPFTGPNVEANQPFKCHLANASGATKYKRITFEDNTGSGFARRMEQALDE